MKVAVDAFRAAECKSDLFKSISPLKVVAVSCSDGRRISRRGMFLQTQSSSARTSWASESSRQMHLDC